MSILIEFLEFIEAAPRPSLQELMQRVLLKSRRLTGAEAGSIFIIRSHGKRASLEAASLQNDSRKIDAARVSVPVDRSSIAGYVAVTGDTVRIDDLYRIPSGKPYRFNTAADDASGYRSQSMLAFALKNYSDRSIGVVQLINRRDKNGRGPLPFTADQAELIQPINHIVGGAIERADMIERISEQNLSLKRSNRTLARQRKQIADLKDQTEESFLLSVRLLARAAELHDEDTGNHIVRTNEYSYMLAKRLGLDEAFCDEIHYSAQLHDVGKMSVDQAVLKKKGGFDERERAEMNRHAEYGYLILKESPRLKMSADIAWGHHEKWDGSGYPRRLKGEEIPIAARILAFADIYDALRAVRPYKPAFTHEQSVKIMLEGDNRIDPKGHFDPKLLDLFRSHHDDMNRIWTQLAD